MKPRVFYFLLLAFISWCCSSSVPGIKVQEDDIANTEVVLTKSDASWRNDSIDIKEPNPTSAETEVYHNSSLRPKLVLKIVPHYPNLASRAGLEGTVYVRVFIDSTGRPRKAVLLKSLVDIFVPPVLHAIMFCKFSPLVVEGKAESIWIAIAVKFHLDGGLPIVDYIEKERYP